MIRILDLESAVRDGIRRAYQRFDFSRSEITGSVGDLVTTLPLVVALAALTDISLPHVLLVFGVFQILAHPGRP
nr:putative sulfate/molybdate transporter [Halococcus thailandensis]